MREMIVLAVRLGAFRAKPIQKLLAAETEFISTGEKLCDERAIAA